MLKSPWQDIPQQTIYDLVQQTFNLLLDWVAQPAHGEFRCNDDDLSMAVYCDPFQQSAVIVRCTQSLANTVAAQLLELQLNDVCEEDRMDAIGELVNVIAGSLRGLLPVLQTMSTPFTIAAQDLTRIATGQTVANFCVGTEFFQLYTVMNHHEATV